MFGLLLQKYLPNLVTLSDAILIVLLLLLLVVARDHD